jgi:hypothetical protein
LEEQHRVLLEGLDDVAEHSLAHLGDVHAQDFDPHARVQPTGFERHGTVLPVTVIR